MRKSFYLSSLLFFCFFLSSATLMAAVGTPGVPAITSNPANDTVCSGDTAWFAIAANDTTGGPVHFTWEVSADGGSTWDTVHNVAPYSGASTDTLKVHSANYLNGYIYMCGASNDSGTTWSSSAILTVDTANAGTITGLAQVCKGTTITFGSTVAGGVWSNVDHSIDTVNSGGSVYGKSQGFDTVKYTVTNVCGSATSSVVVRVDTVVNNLAITGPTTTCVGHTISLMNGNTLGEWIWTASNDNVTVNDMGMVTGFAGGIDTVTYSFENACNDIDTFVYITVDTVLAHGSISGSTNQLCAGSWISLSDAAGGGAWLSGNPGVAVTDMSGNVTGVSQGVAVISYYLSNGCGVSTAMDTVTVFAVASTIIGNDSVGIGGTRLLSDTTINGTWSSNDTSIISIDSAGIAMGVAAGSAIITYSVTNVCGTTFATMILYTGIPHANAVTGADSVCAHSTITLSDNATGGVGTWSSGNTAVATVDNSGTVTGVSFGQTHITYTYTNGFGSATAVHPVYVNVPPIDSITGYSLYNIGGSYPFSAYSKNDTGGWVATPFINGSWTSNNAAVGEFVGTTDAVLVLYGYGTITITYSATNTCGTTDTSFTITLNNPEGVNSVANTSSILNVYPNPSEGNFTINLSSAANEQAVVTITNIVGEKIKEFTMSTNKAYELQLDQPDGVYFLNATTTSAGKYSAKITIAK